MVYPGDLEKRALVSDSLSDDNEEEDLYCSNCGHQWEQNAKFCQKCGTRRHAKARAAPSCQTCCCCTCLLVLVFLVVGIPLGLNYELSSLETWLASVASTVLSATMGVPVTLDAVQINIFGGRAAISDLKVGSPPGFHHDFLDLNSLVFDMDPLSLLRSRLLGSVNFPTVVEEISVKTLHAFVEELSEDSPSNAKIIVDHLNSLAAQAIVSAPTAEQVENSAAEAVHALTTKIKVDLIHLKDVGIGYCGHLCQNLGPATYVVPEIKITDVGKKSNGVFLYQLAEVIVRTLMLAVLKAAPENLRENLLRAVGSGIKDQLANLDFGTVDFGDGSGLQSAGQLAGWASAKVALLPLEATNAAVAFNTKALEAENAIRNSAISSQAKMGLEAAKMGSELTNMGVKANTAFTNMGVNANTKLLNAETKANTFFNDLRNDFTSGFTSGLR